MLIIIDDAQVKVLHGVYIIINGYPSMWCPLSCSTLWLLLKQHPAIFLQAPGALMIVAHSSCSFDLVKIGRTFCEVAKIVIDHGLLVLII